MAVKRLTEEEKALKMQEQARVNSILDVLSMMYEKIQKSKRSDRYIVSDDVNFGVVSGDGDIIVPLKFSNITTSNDKIFKVYGAPTSMITYTGVVYKVSSIFDYEGNMLIKPNIFTKTLNVGKRGILLGQAESAEKGVKHRVQNLSHLIQDPEWAGENGILTIERKIYYIDYETLQVLEFELPEPEIVEKVIDGVPNAKLYTKCKIDLDQNFDNILEVTYYTDTIESYLVDIEESVKQKKENKEAPIHMYKPDEFWEETIVIDKNNTDILDDIMKVFIFEDYRDVIINILKSRVKANPNEKCKFGRRWGKWVMITNDKYPDSFLYERAKLVGKGKMPPKKRPIKIIWA